MGKRALEGIAGAILGRPFRRFGRRRHRSSNLLRGHWAPANFTTASAAVNRANAVKKIDSILPNARMRRPRTARRRPQKGPSSLAQRLKPGDAGASGSQMQPHP
jgi:hypothetical protein